MTKVIFYKDENLITGFCISGHSGYAQSGSDIVCAAVSSAAYMTANTVTDIMLLPAKICEKSAYLSFFLDKESAQKASDVLNGFYLHVKSLSCDYGGYLTVKTLVNKNKYGGAENA